MFSLARGHVTTDDRNYKKREQKYDYKWELTFTIKV